MTQPLPRLEPLRIPVTPSQLAIVRDYLATGDDSVVIAARLGMTPRGVSRSLSRLSRANGFERPSQLMSAVLNRRARLVRRQPHSPVWRMIDSLAG